MNQPLTVEIIIAAALLFSCYTDIKDRLIKNYITFPMMIAGIAVSVALYGISGLKGSLLGILTGLIAGLVLTMIGALCYGDVKLFMGIGAFFGAHFIAEAVLMSLFMAIPVSMIIRPKEFVASLRNIYLFFKLTLFTGKRQKLVPDGETLASIPYAVCILLGCIGAFISKGEVLVWLM